MAPQETYTIVNSVRRVATRLRRAAAPTHARFKQYVCGRRLLRKQTIKVTEADMELYKKQLEKQLIAGAIRIFDPNGREILPPGRQAPGCALMPPIPEPRKGLEETPQPEASADPEIEVEETSVDVACSPGNPCDVPSCTNCKEDAEVEEAPVETPTAEGSPAPKEAPPAEPKTVVPDNLTELPNIGGGRVRKLNAAGIDSFKKISVMRPDRLAKVISVTTDQANEIVEAAFDKAGEA